MANDRKMYSILKDCDRCRVYGTDNTPLADARVQSVGTEVWLYFRTSRLRDARGHRWIFMTGSQGCLAVSASF